MAVYSNRYFDFEGERPDDAPLGSLTYKQYTESDIYELGMKYYFLPMLRNSYEFTQRQGLDRFCLKTSPTFIFYHDRLLDQRPRWMIHDIFFESLQRAGLLDEEILLLYDKVLLLAEDKPDPPYGIDKEKERVILNTSALFTSDEDAQNTIDNLSEKMRDTEISVVKNGDILTITKKLEPPVTEQNEHTNYLVEDVAFLTQKYQLQDGDFRKMEIRDLSHIPENRRWKYKMREFRYKVFTPKQEEEIT